MRALLLLAVCSVIGAPETAVRTAVFLTVTQPTVQEIAPERPADAAWWWIRATVTGYSPHDAIDSGHPHTQDTKTSTMRDWRTHPYGIAADPRILPYGTHIHVPGYLEKSEPDSAWQVDDTGGGMRKSWRRGIVHIDVRYKTEYSAMKFGKRQMLVLVCVEDMTDKQKQRLLPYKAGEL